METMDVFAHHSRAGHAGPDDGACRHKRQVVVATELGEQAAHGRTFDVEAADGFRPFELSLDFGIFLEFRDVVHIHLYSAVLPDDAGALFDMSDAALAQDIQLFEPDVLGHIHVPLGGGKSFGRQVQRRIAGNGLFGDQHTAGMDAPAVGKTRQFFGHLQDACGDVVIATGSFGHFHQPVYFGFGQPVNLAELPQGRAVFERGDGAHQCGMLPAVPLKDVIDHLVALLPRIVDVEIRRTGTFRVDKTLEVQIQLDGVNIGNFQAVGNHAVGTASPAHMIKPARHRIADNIPCDEEIGGETQLVDDLQFVPDTAFGLTIAGTVAVSHPVEGQLFQQKSVVVAAARKNLFVFYGVVIEINGAVAQQLFCICNNRRVGFKDVFQRARRQKGFIGTGKVGSGQPGDDRIFVYRSQIAMKRKISFVAKGHRLQYHKL